MAKASLARDVVAVARGETLSCLWEGVDRVKCYWLALMSKFLEELCKNKKVDVKEIKEKLTTCGVPGFSSSSAASKAASTVERLTDASKYTGAHKQRFDETGKGKGIAGRKDLPDSSGYVQGYINKDSYNKTH
uniref:Tubulin polymerization-promoting protein family member 3 n=1 Tax=Timema monikensis TaxID=170555 RepID=A0A7R9EJF9_9NEOP|nr:unnamed protein product [Timema monikensis]